MRSAIATYTTAILNFLWDSGAGLMLAFILMSTILGIFRKVMRWGRGERFDELRDETLDLYDRTRANYFAHQREPGFRNIPGMDPYSAERNRYYAEMRGGRGYRDKRTRY